MHECINIKRCAIRCDDDDDDDEWCTPREVKLKRQQWRRIKLHTKSTHATHLQIERETLWNSAPCNSISISIWIIIVISEEYKLVIEMCCRQCVGRSFAIELHRVKSPGSLIFNFYIFIAKNINERQTFVRWSCNVFLTKRSGLNIINVW